jgi:hypothetical protein
VYLLDAPQLAFVGDQGSQLADAIPPDAILCHRADIDGSSWSQPGAAAIEESQQLQPDALERFLRTHDDALLVDVRESFEADAEQVQRARGPVPAAPRPCASLDGRLRYRARRLSRGRPHRHTGLRCASVRMTFSG